MLHRTKHVALSHKLLSQRHRCTVISEGRTFVLLCFHFLEFSWSCMLFDEKKTNTKLETLSTRGHIFAALSARGLLCTHDHTLRMRINISLVAICTRFTHDTCIHAHIAFVFKRKREKTRNKTEHNLIGWDTEQERFCIFGRSPPWIYRWAYWSRHWARDGVYFWSEPLNIWVGWSEKQKNKASDVNWQDEPLLLSWVKVKHESWQKQIAVA